MSETTYTRTFFGTNLTEAETIVTKTAAEWEEYDKERRTKQEARHAAYLAKVEARNARLTELRLTNPDFDEISELVGDECYDAWY